MQAGDIFAGYTIERTLGQGGMGTVYLARHPRLPRSIALKLLNRELTGDGEAQRRFEREADLVAQLDHPNIVAVYDRGTDQGHSWIAIQYIDGIDAATLTPATLPAEHALHIISETAKALDYAHARGVMHRDVKPANILLARAQGGQHRVFLTDFGIARMRDDATKLTQTGTFTATLAYASPEQLSGGEVDHRSDQYSLACTLYWLLTGQSPFPADNPAAVITGHLSQPVRPVSNLRTGLSPALDAVMNVALAKQPQHRYNSCAEFAAAATEALQGRTSAATHSRTSATQLAQPFTAPAQAAQPYTAPANASRPATGPETQLARPVTGPPAPAYAPAMPGGYPQPYARPRKSNTGLIVGLIAGGLVIVICAVSAVVWGASKAAEEANKPSAWEVSASSRAAATSSIQAQAMAKAPKKGECVDKPQRDFGKVVSCDSLTAANKVTEVNTRYSTCPAGHSQDYTRDSYPSAVYFCLEPTLREGQCYKGSKSSVWQLTTCGRSEYKVFRRITGSTSEMDCASVPGVSGSSSFTVPSQRVTYCIGFNR